MKFRFLVVLAVTFSLVVLASCKPGSNAGNLNALPNNTEQTDLPDQPDTGQLNNSNQSSNEVEMETEVPEAQDEQVPVEIASPAVPLPTTSSPPVWPDGPRINFSVGNFKFKDIAFLKSGKAAISFETTEKFPPTLYSASFTPKIQQSFPNYSCQILPKLPQRLFCYGPPIPEELYFDIILQKQAVNLGIWGTNGTSLTAEEITNVWGIGGTTIVSTLWGLQGKLNQVEPELYVWENTEESQSPVSQPEYALDFSQGIKIAQQAGMQDLPQPYLLGASQALLACANAAGSQGAVPEACLGLQSFLPAQTGCQNIAECAQACRSSVGLSLSGGDFAMASLIAEIQKQMDSLTPACLDFINSASGQQALSFPPMVLDDAGVPAVKQLTFIVQAAELLGTSAAGEGDEDDALWFECAIASDPQFSFLCQSLSGDDLAKYAAYLETLGSDGDAGASGEGDSETYFDCVKNSPQGLSFLCSPSFDFGDSSPTLITEEDNANPGEDEGSDQLDCFKNNPIARATCLMDSLFGSDGMVFLSYEEAQFWIEFPPSFRECAVDLGWELTDVQDETAEGQPALSKQFFSYWRTLLENDPGLLPDSCKSDEMVEYFAPYYNAGCNQTVPLEIWQCADALGFRDFDGCIDTAFQVDGFMNNSYQNALGVVASQLLSGEQASMPDACRTDEFYGFLDSYYSGDGWAGGGGGSGGGSGGGNCTTCATTLDCSLHPDWQICSEGLTEDDSLSSLSRQCASEIGWLPPLNTFYDQANLVSYITLSTPWLVDNRYPTSCYLAASLTSGKTTSQFFRELLGTYSVLEAYSSNKISLYTPYYMPKQTIANKGKPGSGGGIGIINVCILTPPPPGDCWIYNWETCSWVQDPSCYN